MCDEDTQKRTNNAEMLIKEYSAEKLELEIKKIKDRSKTPFYRSNEFLRPLIAGLSLSLILAAYIQYIFLPAQTRLIVKSETVEYISQQKEALYKAEMAKLEFLHEKIKEDARVARIQLEEAVTNLNIAREQNESLEKKIESFNAKRDDKVDFSEFKGDLKEGKKVIDQQLAKVQAVKASIDTARDIAVGQVGKIGWIYIGYRPDKKWEFRTIDITSELPTTGNEYKIIKGVNIRTHAPKFSWFRYKFGNVDGYLVPGQTVQIIAFEKIGNDKLWAKIKTVTGED